MNDSVNENTSKEVLLTKIDELQSQLNSLREEREQDERLDYAWTGNLGHWYWNVKNNKVTFNNLKVKALGYTDQDIPEEVDYQFFTERLHPDDYKPVMQNMSEHLHGKRQVYEVEYRIRAVDGSWKWFYDRGKVTKRDESGKAVFMAGIVFDITKKKEVEERMANLVGQLEKENQMKNKFISVLAHDLRNPIGLLTSYMDMIKENLEENDLALLKKNIALIENISVNTFELLNTLIQWAISKDDLDKIKKEDVRLDSLIDKVIAHQINIASRKNICIIHDETFKGSIHSDPVMLSTILRNLLSNAIKFSREGSKVWIKSKMIADHLEVSVIDKGVGMSQLDLERLLSEDDFYKSREGTFGEKGAGIGLNLCHNFVKKLGGSITGSSSPGEGTEMTVTIPVQ